MAEMQAQLAPLEVGARVFKVADKFALQVGEVMSRSDDMSAGDVVLANFSIGMMGNMWQLAANMTKEMSEPLKSIVNK